MTESRLRCWRPSNARRGKSESHSRHARGERRWQNGRRTRLGLFAPRRGGQWDAVIPAIPSLRPRKRRVGEPWQPAPTTSSRRRRNGTSAENRDYEKPNRGRRRPRRNSEGFALICRLAGVFAAHLPAQPDGFAEQASLVAAFLGNGCMTVAGGGKANLRVHVDETTKAYCSSGARALGEQSESIQRFNAPAALW